MPARPCIATASSDERLEPLCALGLDHGINYSDADWVAKVRELTGGVGVDLVVDSVGGKVLQGSVACLRYRGRAITVGSAGRDPQPFDVSVLGMSNQSLTGVFLGAEIGTERGAADDRRVWSTTSAPDGWRSWSTAPIRSRTRPRRTRSSRAARPSAGWC